LAFPDAGCGDQATEPLAKSAPQWQISAMEIGLRFFMCRMRWWVVALMLLNQALLAGPVVEEKVTHADAVFRVVRATPDQVELVWKDAKGVPYRSFDKVHAALTAQGKTPRFLMNAGLFQEGGIPCGLHVERGVVLRPLNLNEGYGNFHLKPNGVCWIEIEGTKRRVVIDASETYQQYAATRPPSGPVLIETAVQSGPLLLIGGRRHPAFREGSPNKLHRNGVGVDTKGRLVFAMTDAKQSVNFWDFAGLFLKLECQSALFLDGNLSQMSVNPAKPVGSNLFGAIFVISD
jgi:uncharacterized protein YigE (DUF2233 family)